MNKTAIAELALFGQSAWLDNINRAMIEDGTLKRMIGLGLRGVTSNPTIFDKAISKSSVYDSQIEELRNAHKSTFEIYDELTVKDIQDAADLFKPVYEQTKGLDGYISLEVNPKLAFNTEGTIKETQRLFQKVNRPNVMFKVPSTNHGLKATEELIAGGININITLIFSLRQYLNAAGAYIKGIQRLLQNKGDLDKLRSVASVFVSRIDTRVDNQLTEMIDAEKDQAKIARLSLLKGRAAVANCSLIYQKFLEIFSASEFKQIQVQGAHTQRVLWGSTSTKDPVYSDIKYVTELIGKDTVNTIPEQTLQAFLDHGVVKEALTTEAQDGRAVIDGLQEVGINIESVCAKLLQEGVSAFEKSFDSLLHSLAEKMNVLCQR